MGLTRVRVSFVPRSASKKIGKEEVGSLAEKVSSFYETSRQEQKQRKGRSHRFWGRGEALKSCRPSNKERFFTKSEQKRGESDKE